MHTSNLGYGALILGALFTLYKLGILDCIKSCISKRLCLFCVKTSIETPTHVANYSTTVQPLIQPEVPNKLKRVKV